VVVTDYDRTHRILSVSKARVDGIDKDCTTTYEDRRIKLCRRAVPILERQLRLKDQPAIVLFKHGADSYSSKIPRRGDVCMSQNFSQRL
jgi:hypothetical protein